MQKIKNIMMILERLRRKIKVILAQVRLLFIVSIFYGYDNRYKILFADTNTECLPNISPPSGISPTKWAENVWAYIRDFTVFSNLPPTAVKMVQKKQLFFDK